MKVYPKRIWIVGASEGIGIGVSRLLLSQQYQVVASSRQAESSPALLSLKRAYPEQLSLLDCDVTKPEQLAKKAQQAWDIYDGLDEWFYNVGTYQPMQIEQWNPEQFRLMNQTNYLGAVELMQHLWPRFKQQGHGKWIWNISLASDFGLPYGGGYSAPKAALMNLAESLQPELKKHQIELKVINHGFVKTRLTEKNDFPMPGLMNAEKAAHRIVESLNRTGFETRFPWQLSLFLSALKRLPKSLSLVMTRNLLREGH